MLTMLTTINATIVSTINADNVEQIMLTMLITINADNKRLVSKQSLLLLLHYTLYITYYFAS